MSDPILKRTDEIAKKLVEDVKQKRPQLAKMKEMAKLAQEIGEPVPELDEMIKTAEVFADMILEKLDKPKSTKE